MHLNEESRVRKPVDIRPVHIGDMKIRSKLKFEVVTAKVVEEGGKKFVVSVTISYGPITMLVLKE